MTIHFVAIAKKDTKGFRIKASYSEETSQLRQHWEQVTISVLASAEGNYRVEETLPSGKANFLAKKYDSKVHVVITSHEYPFWLAVECIDELSTIDGSTTPATSTTITSLTTAATASMMAATSSLLMSKDDKYRKRLQHCIHIFTKYSKNEPGCVLYDMRIMEEIYNNNKNGNDHHQYHENHHPSDDDDDDASSSAASTMVMIPYSPEFWQQRKEYIDTVHKYLQLREQEVQHQKIKQAQDKVEEIKDQMTMVVTAITLQNMAQTQRLQEQSNELLQQAMVFRKSAAALRKTTESNYNHSLGLALVGTVAVASTGGVVALVTGAEGLALLCGAVVGGVLGYQFSDAETKDWFFSLPRLIIQSWVTTKVHGK